LLYFRRQYREIGPVSNGMGKSAASERIRQKGSGSGE